jgi:hypothetical protein
MARGGPTIPRRSSCRRGVPADPAESSGRVDRGCTKREKRDAPSAPLLAFTPSIPPKLPHESPAPPSPQTETPVLHPPILRTQRPSTRARSSPHPSRRPVPSNGDTGPSPPIFRTQRPSTRARPSPHPSRRTAPSSGDAGPSPPILRSRAPQRGSGPHPIPFPHLPGHPPLGGDPVHPHSRRPVRFGSGPGGQASLPVPARIPTAR